MSPQHLLVTATQGPLLSALNVANPSNVERLSYIARLARDLVGLISAIDKVVTIYSLIETTRDWLQHKAQYADGLDRVRGLLSVAALVSVLRDREVMLPLQQSFDFLTKLYLNCR